MNPLSDIQIAAERIVNIDVTKCGPHGLYVSNKTILAGPLRVKPTDSVLVTEITPFECTHGISSGRWNRIDDKLRKLRKEGLL